MKSPTEQVISQLQAGTFKGSCPSCSNEFFLRDAILFAVDGSRPQEALEAIRKARAAIQERKLELIAAYERMSSKSQKTSESVNIGKIVEKIIPSFPTFLHEPEDCRALFEPIDYLIFSGLAVTGTVDSLHFVDVKSGRSQLKPSQRAIRDAVLDGRVEFGLLDRVVRDE